MYTNITWYLINDDQLSMDEEHVFDNMIAFTAHNIISINKSLQAGESEVDGSLSRNRHILYIYLKIHIKMS